MWWRSQILYDTSHYSRIMGGRWCGISAIRNVRNLDRSSRYVNVHWTFVDQNKVGGVYEGMVEKLGPQDWVRRNTFHKWGMWSVSDWLDEWFVYIRVCAHFLIQSYQPSDLATPIGCKLPNMRVTRHNWVHLLRLWHVNLGAMFIFRCELSILGLKFELPKSKNNWSHVYALDSSQ